MRCRELHKYAAEPAGSGISGVADEVCARRDAAEAVGSARPDVKFGLAAGLPDGVGVRDGLVTEHFGRSDVEERLWQIREFGGADGGSVLRDIVGAVPVAQVRLPGGGVGRAVPETAA
jgi:hypothetical protein